MASHVANLRQSGDLCFWIVDHVALRNLLWQFFCQHNIGIRVSARKPDAVGGVGLEIPNCVGQAISLFPVVVHEAGFFLRWPAKESDACQNVIGPIGVSRPALWSRVDCLMNLDCLRTVRLLRTGERSGTQYDRDD